MRLTLRLLVLLLSSYSLVAAEDFYELLGVSRDADDRTIRRAFKKLAIAKHPDKNPGDEDAHALFIRINRAYEVLKDEELRKKYDQHGEQGLSDNFQGGNHYESWQFYNDKFGIYDDDAEIVTLSRTDFQRQVIDSGEIWFVNFYSTFCSHCHQLAPTWRKFAQEMDGAIRIGAVNCAEDPGLCQSQNVMGYPALLLYPQRIVFNGPRELEVLTDFVMQRLKGEVFQLTSENVQQLATEFETYATRPWVVDFCDDTDRCLSKDNRRKLASMLDGLANIGTVQCSYGQKDSLCDTLDRTEGVLYFPPSKIDKDSGEELTTLDAKEIASLVISRLQPLEVLSASEVDQLFSENEMTVSNTLVVFAQSSDQLRELNEFARVPGKLIDYRVAFADCSSLSSKICDRLFVEQQPHWPRAIVFKQTGGYEINYEKKQGWREVALWAKEAAGSPLISLTPERHEEITHGDELWIVDYFAPWCPPCQRMLPELRRLHSNIENENANDLHVGSVDCQANPTVCQTVGVQTYPTTILYHKGKSFRSVGSHTVDGLLDFVENSLNPSVDELTPEDFEKRVVGREEGITWVVDFFAPWCGPCQQLAPEFQKVARAVRAINGDVYFGSVDCQAHQAFCQLQQVNSYPTVRLYPYSQKSAHISRHFDYPPNMWRDAGSIQRWVVELMPSKVEKLGGDIYARVLGSTEPWLVDFYAPWCGHCVQFAPTLEILAGALDGRVGVGKVDCDAWPGVCQSFGIRAYPTVRYYAGVQNGQKQDVQGLTIQSQDKDQILGWMDQLLSQRRPKDEL